jgi:hypothetical protein
VSKIISFFLIFCFVFADITPAFAANDEPYRYEDTKQLSPEEVNIWKYKMSRISVRQEFGKWEIIEGVNTVLTDMQLLKLVNSENIATERLKNIEFKQNISSLIAIGGLVVGAVSALFFTNIVKTNNNTIYGVAAVIAGLGMIVTGNLISPLMSDETDHVISIDEARNAAEKYNVQLRKNLKIENDIP